MPHALIKTSKGLREAAGKTNELPERLRDVLKLCKGQFIAEEVVASVPDDQQQAVALAIVELTQQEYLREIHELREEDAESDALAKPADARVPAEEVAEADEHDDAAESLRQGVASRRGKRDEATLEHVRQLNESARRAADERAKREAEEQALLEAEEAAQRAAEEKARQEAAERARQEAELKAKREAAEKAQRVAAEKAKREAERKAKLEAERLAKQEAEKRAQREAEEREREAIRERLALRAAQRKKRIMSAGLFFVILPALIIGLLHVVPFEGKRVSFEQMAGSALGTQVSIRQVHLALTPAPHWRLDEVSISSEGATTSIPHVRLGISVAELLKASPEFEFLHLENPRIPLAAAIRALHHPTLKLPVKSNELIARGLTLEGDHLGLQPMNLRASLEQGHLKSFTADGNDPEAGRISVEGQSGQAADGWQITIKAQRYTLPLGFNLPLTDVSIKAQVLPESLNVSEFAARLHDGDISGNGTLTSREGWRLAAKLDVRKLDTHLAAPAWFKQGFASGAVQIAAVAPAASQLYPNAMIAGNFAMTSGMLAGVDLDRVVQGRGVGEQYRFESLTGNVAGEMLKFDISDLKLTAGELATTGSLTIKPNREVNGRFLIDVKAGTSSLNAGFAVVGTTASPQFQRQ